jgi:hypothetical protein
VTRTCVDQRPSIIQQWQPEDCITTANHLSRLTQWGGDLADRDRVDGEQIDQDFLGADATQVDHGDEDAATNDSRVSLIK